MSSLCHIHFGSLDSCKNSRNILVFCRRRFLFFSVTQAKISVRNLRYFG